jgi:hypothetical protein
MTRLDGEKKGRKRAYIIPRNDTVYELNNSDEHQEGHEGI